MNEAFIIKSLQTFCPCYRLDLDATCTTASYLRATRTWPASIQGIVASVMWTHPDTGNRYLENNTLMVMLETNCWLTIFSSVFQSKCFFILFHSWGNNSQRSGSSPTCSSIWAVGQCWRHPRLLWLWYRSADCWVDHSPTPLFRGRHRAGGPFSSHVEWPRK